MLLFYKPFVYLFYFENIKNTYEFISKQLKKKVGYNKRVTPSWSDKNPTMS